MLDNAGSAQRILVIDDDEALRNTLSESIRRSLHCEVHTAADRAEARALLGCYSYALVLIDLSFSRGRLEGLDLIEDLSATPFRPGLVAMSGEPIAGTRALSMGADVFLEKPLPPAEINCALREVLNKRKFAAPRFQRADASLRLDKFMMEGGTRVYIQPIYKVDCAPAVLSAVEFLTRGPAGSLYERADVLFAYAREARVESILDLRCIKRALAAAVHVPAHVGLCFNVHASTLCHPPDFADWLFEAAAEERVELARITVEIVEHSPAWNQAAFLQSLARLRKLGVKIAIDDVGLGHSNYQMMIDAHPDCFKLDRYIVQGCSTNRGRSAVVASVVRLAADFGATVVAEGVEQADDLRELREQGIQYIQGFLFCSPKSVADAFASVLTNAVKPCSCLPEMKSGGKQCALDSLGLCSGNTPEPYTPWMREPRPGVLYRS